MERSTKKRVDFRIYWGHRSCHVTFLLKIAAYHSHSVLKQWIFVAARTYIINSQVKCFIWKIYAVERIEIIIFGSFLMYTISIIKLYDWETWSRIDIPYCSIITHIDILWSIYLYCTYIYAQRFRISLDRINFTRRLATYDIDMLVRTPSRYVHALVNEGVIKLVLLRVVYVHRCTVIR